jgi:hypothetical protein
MTYGVSQPSLTPDAIALLNAMALGVTTKDAGTTAGTQLHGPGGLLATPGLNKQIPNAMIMPRGISGRIPVRPSINTNEIFAILTGQLASTGTEPSEACAAWPLVGQFKVCKQQHPFGQQGRESQVLNIKYAGQITNRGEFTDNVLFGKPDMGDNVTPGPINWGQILQTEYEKKLGELYNGYFRDYSRYIYTGNPQVTAGSLGWMQYRGLDLLVATGKRDAISGVLCPAADSVVYDFNGTNATTSGATAYSIVANIVANMERLQVQLGFDTKWVLVMSYRLYWALTQIWPCVYATAGCVSPNTIVRTSSLEEQANMRDGMRARGVIKIEGKDYEVVIDDMITETPAAGGVVGTYQSDFYMLPLTANGQPTLYWEYFPFDAQATAAAAQLAPQGYFQSLMNGRFLQSRLSPTHTCVQVEIVERPRLILMTPFLAAKFQNLRYNITVAGRDAYPDDAYFADGGGTTTPLPYFYPNSTGG